jgi:hypothetical protein
MKKVTKIFNATIPQQLLYNQRDVNSFQVLQVPTIDYNMLIYVFS